MNKEIIIMFKNEENEGVVQNSEEFFLFETKIVKGKTNSEELYMYLFFNEDFIEGVVEKFKRKNYQEKKKKKIQNFLEKNDEEEEEKVEDFFLENERKTLEIEKKFEEELKEIDQNELLENLISEENEHVLKCEKVSINCFDALIGRKS